MKDPYRLAFYMRNGRAWLFISLGLFTIGDMPF